MANEKDWRRWIPAASGVAFVMCSRFPDLPGLWDLSRQPEVIPHWLGILRANAQYMLQIFQAEGHEEQVKAAAGVVEVLEGLFRDLETGKATDQVRTIHEVTLIRENLLRSHGLVDPYQGIKAGETRRLLPQAASAAAEAWERGAEDGATSALAAVLSSVLAGNLFDLGSRTTQEAFRRGELNTGAAAERLRPWAEESLRALEPDALELLVPKPVALDQPAEGRVLLFADNAGADFLLGLLPAALFWARRWEVWIVVNSLPASSDITIEEARAHLALLAGTPVGSAMHARRLRLVASGTGSPGIDLRHVSEELNRVAENAAWILLEGQGRGVETNWTTLFRCPVFRVALVKDALVAREIGLEPGSPVLRWDRGEE